MKASELLKMARKRAGLTQKQLAEKAGTTQPSVARWEAGEREPGFDTVQRLIRACDLEMSVSLNQIDLHDLGLALGTREMTPGQRVENMLEWTRTMETFVSGFRRSG